MIHGKKAQQNNPVGKNPVANISRYHSSFSSIASIAGRHTSKTILWDNHVHIDCLSSAQYSITSTLRPSRIGTDSKRAKASIAKLNKWEDCKDRSDCNQWLGYTSWSIECRPLSMEIIEHITDLTDQILHLDHWHCIYEVDPLIRWSLQCKLGVE